MSDAPPRRVVIDPNVFISATITPRGALGPVLEVIASGDSDLHAESALGVTVLTPRELLTRFDR